MKIISPTGRKLTFNNKKVEYESPFLVLNNFDNISDNISISKKGPDIELKNEVCNIENSNVFNNENCLKMTNYNSNINGCKSVKTIPILADKIYTLETYYSNYSGGYSSDAYTEIGISSLRFEASHFTNEYRIQIGYKNSNNYILYNGANYFGRDSGAYYFTLPVSLSTPLHFAAVIKDDYAYIFGNGVLYVKASIKRNDSNDYIVFNREKYPAYIAVNFISIRIGDFSNNLQSFTVPTEKYKL